MTQEQENFINDYLKQLINGDAAIFAGAGLSVGAGFVNWRGLLEDIAKDVGLEVDREKDLISLAQFHVNEKGGRGKLNQRIIEEFTENVELTENHKILARLPIHNFWTTNYDSLIETSLEQASKRVDVKHQASQLATQVYRRQAVVYKMHGDAKSAAQATLTKDDYENYHRKNEGFITALSSDLVSKTFLFVGFSFTDPNLDYILSRVRLFLDGNTRPHFCIIKKVNREDADCPTEGDFVYNTRRQQLMLLDLRRFQIQPVLVDEYEEFTEILRELETRLKRNTIFISGSAAQYTPYSEDESLEFIHELSRKLVEQKYSVVNGFGLGIGSAVINGALEAVYNAPQRFSEEQLIMRPFPQKKTGTSAQELGDLWRVYRERMISFAGIAVFVFGNKLVGGNPEPELADGVRKEFAIAKAQGVVLLPIGATGSVAQELWNDMQGSSNQFPSDDPEVEKLFLSLGDSEKPLKAHLKTILSLVSKFNHRS